MRMMTGIVLALLGLVAIAALPVATAAPQNPDAGIWKAVSDLQSDVVDLQEAFAGATVHFGHWSQEGVYQVNEWYTAKTDGFICVYATVSEDKYGPVHIQGVTPRWVVRTSTSVHPDEIGGFMMPVRAGDEWMVYTWGESLNVCDISWLPLTA